MTEAGRRTMIELEIENSIEAIEIEIEIVIWTDKEDKGEDKDIGINVITIDTIGTIEAIEIRNVKKTKTPILMRGVRLNEYASLSLKRPNSSKHNWRSE